MKSVSNVVITHAWALVFALVVGVVSGIPQYLATEAIGSQYHGIPFLFQDNETIYLTRIHEFLDGHPSVASPFLYEYKNGTASVMPPVGEAGYFGTSQLSDLPLSTIVIASKYILPALLFLLLYILTLSVLRDVPGDHRLAAIASGMLVTLGYSLIHPSEALALLSGAYGEPYLSLWTRLVHPISGALLLFGYLSALRLARPERYWWAIIAALLLGFSTGYIYAFGIGATVVGLLMLVSLSERNIRQALLYVGILVGALLINVPHLMSVSSQVGGTALSSGLKAGLLLTHMSLISFLLVLALILGLVVCAPRWWKQKSMSHADPAVFALITLAACVIAMNQQIITGRTVWPQHFIQYGIPLIYFSAVIVYETHVAHFLKRWRFAPYIALIALSCAVAIASLSTYHFALKDFATVNRYAGALQYLDQTPGSCVVFPLEEYEHMNPYVTAFTHCDTYYTHYVFMGVPPGRIMDNMLAYLYMMGVTPATVDAFLASHQDKLWAVLFRDWRDIFFQTKDPWLKSISDQSEMNAWLASTTVDVGAKYKVFYASDPHAELLKYRLDYVIWDSTGETPFTPSHFPFLIKAYESEGIVVYRVE